MYMETSQSVVFQCGSYVSYIILSVTELRWLWTSFHHAIHMAHQVLGKC